MEFDAKSHFFRYNNISLLLYFAIFADPLRNLSSGIAVWLKHVIYEITVITLLNTPRILFVDEVTWSDQPST